MRTKPALLLYAALAFATLAGFATEGHTSGGGTIEITHPQLRVVLATGRKTPARGDDDAYNQSVREWERANAPVANAIATAIERVLPRYAAHLTTGDADAELSTEGVVVRGDASAERFRLAIDIELERSDVGCTATVVLRAHPGKAVVRALAADVEAAARASQRLALAPAASYRGYWLDSGDARALLLTQVPVAQLADALANTRYRPVSLPTFRRAPALLLDVHAGLVVANSAGFLLGNPTRATLDPKAQTLVLQLNGSLRPAAKLRPATRAEIAALLAAPLGKRPDRTRYADDLDFLASLVPQLAQ